MKYTFTIIILWLFAGSVYSQTAKPVFSWAGFMSRQSMRWDSVSTDPNTGLLLGNGVLNANVYKDGDRGLRFDVGRSDVSGVFLLNSGLATGHMVLKTSGKITGISMELDIYNAAATGTIRTSMGVIKFNACIPLNSSVLQIRAVGAKQEQSVK